MKKLLLFVLVLLTLSAFTVKDNPVVNKETVSNFENTHKEAKNIRWYPEENFDIVYFSLYEKECRIWYDKKGKFIKSIQYYNPKYLPLLIKEKIKEQYPNRTVTGITEVSSDEHVEFHIVMYDDKHWYNMQSNINGSIVQLKKYKKA